MREQLISRLDRANNLLLDFLEHIPESALGSKLASLPSNTIGQQLWCIAGARKSYLKAAKAGEWRGFECSLTGEDILRKDRLEPALKDSSADIVGFLKSIDSLSKNQENFLLDLLEHEIQHHGQLIRYLYGLKIGAPSSWKDRYALD